MIAASRCHASLAQSSHGRRATRLCGLMLVTTTGVAGAFVHAHDAPFFHTHGILDHDVVVMDPVPADTTPVWPTPARMFVSRCIDDRPDVPTQPPGGVELPGLCGNKPVANDFAVVWDEAGTEKQFVVPSTNVRFGPFSLKRVGIGKAANTSDTYEITVLARSPAVYGPGPDGGATFLGAHAGFREIGRSSITLTGSDERTVHVDARLPGVFSAVRIVARVADEELQFPPGCGALPPSATNPEQLDAPCLQGGVNPLAILEMKWVPLTILYEPPGNCSWSNLTQSHAAGASIRTTVGSSTSSHLISDSGFFWDAEHLDVEQVTEVETGRQTMVLSTLSDSIGTRFGLPLSAPGNPLCNQPGTPVPDRIDQGPGRGDVFVLLRNADFLYWDSGTVSGTALSPVSTPGNAQSTVLLTAHQIRTGEGLPAGVSFSDEERDSILALDPFRVLDTGDVETHLDGDRFLPLGQVIELGQSLSFEHSAGHEMKVSGDRTVTEALKSIEGSSTGDPVVEMTMSAIQFGSSAAATKGAQAALVGLNPGLAAVAKNIKINLPKLFTDTSTTTTATTYRRSNLIQTVADNAVTQQFFLRDTNEGFSVSLYWDSLFGTYVFKPHPPGAGFVVDPSLRRLPVVVWSIDPSGSDSDRRRVSSPVRRRLAELGATALEPAPDAVFQVARGRSKVAMPARIDLGALASEAMALPPMPAVAGTRMQSMYIARDAQGKPVAQVWVSEP